MEYTINNYRDGPLVFVCSKEKNLEYNSPTLFLHQIQFKRQFGKWSKGRQQNRHKTYKIKVPPLNCADVTRASDKLLIILCKDTGAISIYRRNSLNLFTDKPLVEV